MTDQEIAALFAVVRAACPAQRAEQLTPDVWAEILDGCRYQDAAIAVRNLARRQTWIAPGEVYQEIRRIRSARLALVPALVPNEVEGVTSGEELRALRRAVADGRIADTDAARRYNHWGGSLHLQDQRRALDAGPAAVRGELA